MRTDTQEEIRLLRESALATDPESVETEESTASVPNRYPVCFLNLADILNAVADHFDHTPGSCDCRFCSTQPMIKIP